MKPGFKLICSKLSDIGIYNIKVKINKINKIDIKKYITDFSKEDFISHLNINNPFTWCAC
tara:strand:+ start:1161 stop:1340 length:180 start_codon:yes stop_codon:yes gene_type:complete